MMNQKNTRKNPGFSAKRTAGAIWRKGFLFLLAIAIVGFIAYGLMPKPIPVEVSVVERGRLQVSVLEEGKTRIRQRYIVSPPIGGALHRVNLRAGARIEAGKTVLAVIEPELSGFLTPRMRAEALARVNAAQAGKMLRQSELERTRAALNLAQIERERGNALLREEVISRQEWDVLDTRFRILERESDSAAFALRMAAFEVEQAQAALLQFDASEPDNAKPYRIIAPIDGVVLHVFEESARVVAPGTPIMEVGDLGDLEVEIELLSSDAVLVAPGAEAIIEYWGGEMPLRAQVTVLEPAGFTKVSALGVEEQRVIVRADILDRLPDDRQMGDRFRVEARIITEDREDALLVPTGAVFRKGGEWVAFVAQAGQSHLRGIELGANNGVHAEVLNGLAEGDLVIMHPPDNVRDGASILVKTEEGL